MASGFAAGAGADMLQEILRRKFTEALAQKKLQEDIRQADMQHQIQQAQLGQGQQRIGLEGERVGLEKSGQDFQRERAGVADERYVGEAPIRLANLAHMNAQTTDISRKPQAEQEQRDFVSGRDKQQHIYSLGEIGAQGANALRVAQTNHPTGGSSTAGDYGEERATRMRDMVGDILPDVNRMNAGVGSVLAGIPESGARNLRAKLDALKANVGFKELQEMRNASKTGGALGQVSDTENRLLASALGSLDQGQSPDQLKGTLNKIIGSLDRWEAAKAKYGAATATPAGASGKGGFRVIGEVK